MKMLSPLSLGLHLYSSAAASPTAPVGDARASSTGAARRPAPVNTRLLIGDTVIFSVTAIAGSVMARDSATSASVALSQTSTWAMTLMVPFLILALHQCGHYRQRQRAGVEALQLLAVIGVVVVVANILARVIGHPLPLAAQLIYAALFPALLLQRHLTGLAVHRIAVSPTGMRDDTVRGLARSSAISPGLVGKRILDTTVAVLALAFLSPLLLAVAILVKTDRGPALFGHTRLGQGGRRFRCLKFRTMGVDAEDRLQALLANDPAAAAEWAATQKLAHDPRVTGIGAVLRKTSLDELPQLLNVLHGEMSLVGPRPIVEAEVVRYGDNIDCYYAVRPGVTGLWQVSGRSETSYADRVELDTRYVRNWSLGQDLSILLKTVPAVLARRGAV